MIASMTMMSMMYDATTVAIVRDLGLVSFSSRRSRHLLLPSSILRSSDRGDPGSGGTGR